MVWRPSEPRSGNLGIMARRPELDQPGRILYLTSVSGNPNPVKDRGVGGREAGQGFSRHGEAEEESHSSVSGS